MDRVKFYFSFNDDVNDGNDVRCSSMIVKVLPARDLYLKILKTWLEGFKCKKSWST